MFQARNQDFPGVCKEARHRQNFFLVFFFNSNAWFVFTVDGFFITLSMHTIKTNLLVDSHLNYCRLNYGTFELLFV